MSTSRPWPGLIGRRDECRTLSRLLEGARAGRSQVVVLRGEAGIGKTSLIEFLVERAGGCRVLRADGVASETTLAYAGLHQMWGSHLGRLERIPAPQRDALATAFGLRDGPPPDRLLVGLGVLSLVREVAGDTPVLCAVDDMQWVDEASAQALAFAARRVRTERVAMVFAARGFGEEPILAGLPELAVPGLPNVDAALLLEYAVAGTVDPRVRERILAESLGNPFTLLELTRGLSAAELTFGGIGAPPDTPWMHRVEQGFAHQAARLPPPARRLLLVAAAEPVGDVPLFWRAVERLGLGPEAATEAEACGLIEFRDRVRFRHPLVRFAVYRAAPPAERRMVHEALADVTEADVDPDRRAWHRARAALGPDEAVASELERSTNRALAHGDFDAAATFLEQAATLTPDPARRVRRSVDGAQARVEAGAFEEARALLNGARTGTLNAYDRARIDLVEAQIAASEKRSDEALPLLLAAAGQLKPLQPDLARHAHLDALATAIRAGRFAGDDVVRAVAAAARSAVRGPTSGSVDALLEGLAVSLTDGYVAAAPVLRSAVWLVGQEKRTAAHLRRSSWLPAFVAASLFADGWDVLTRRQLDLVRETGARSALPQALDARALVHLFTGDLAAATRVIEEIQAIADVSAGSRRRMSYAQVCHAAMTGQSTSEVLIAGHLDQLQAAGEGLGVTMVLWVRAMLCNGLGRYGDALAAAQEAVDEPLELGAHAWALAELVEAAARTGNSSLAATALERLSALTRAAGTDWALGVEASRRGLLSEGRAGDALHRAAIERLGSTTMRVDLARAMLLYGEWLHRQGRRIDARNQLRAAHEALAGMGVATFADRARRELLAGGGAGRSRPANVTPGLTPQEAHIARLATAGLSNADIGSRLHLSPRTIEWHLRRVFIKLSVKSRQQLRVALAEARPGVSIPGTVDI